MFGLPLESKNKPAFRVKLKLGIGQSQQRAFSKIELLCPIHTVTRYIIRIEDKNKALLLGVIPLVARQLNKRRAREKTTSTLALQQTGALTGW